MKVLNLFSETSKNRFRAYMSSALTSFPNLSAKESNDKRKTIMDLNVFLKKICQESNIDLYLPQESSNPKSSHDDGLSPNEVYLLDRWRVAESDFIIVNANELSFGVGQEIEIANSIGLPAILFFDTEKEKTGEVSRMLRGAPCIFVPPGFTSENSFIIYEKDNRDDLSTQLKDRIRILKDFIKSGQYYSVLLQMELDNAV